LQSEIFTPRFQAQGKFMKEVAILLLVAFTLSGCGSSRSTSTQTAAGGTWQAQMFGGIGQDSGFSFITQFTVVGDGTLSISSFQFLNAPNATQCFPVSGGTVAGKMMLTENTSNFSVTGPFSFTVQSGGNTLSLSGNVTGTENGLNSTTLASGSVTGTWTLMGGTGCNDTTGGTFTMTQS
jgi:hypothetical protein